MTRIALLVLATFVIACGSAASEPVPDSAPASAAAVDVAPLDAKATALREWFVANDGKPRFVTILSPT
jgi:hypothetical protein